MKLTRASAPRFYWHLSRNFDHPWPPYFTLRDRVGFALRWTWAEWRGRA